MMMERTIAVELGPRTYPVRVGAALLEQAGALAADLACRSAEKGVTLKAKYK